MLKFYSTFIQIYLYIDYIVSSLAICGLIYLYHSKIFNLLAIIITILGILVQLIITNALCCALKHIDKLENVLIKNGSIKIEDVEE